MSKTIEKPETEAVDLDRLVRRVPGGFMCRRNVHLWLDRGDAAKCCNGHKRTLVIGGGDNQQIAGGDHCGRAWIPSPNS